jgi:[ribosomal protein S18]-alanine N-acetyltransferase
MTQITPFRISELPRVMEIEYATFPEDAYSRKMFLALQRDCPELFLVARRAGRVAGYMVTSASARHAEIVSIAVDPGSQKLGIGTALMAYTIRRLKKVHVQRLELAVRCTNTAAIRFYRNFGFDPVKRVPEYYADGGDAIRMRKHL